MDERYLRNMLLDGFGNEGQNRLIKSRVLIIGIGGVGSYLSTIMAGLGTNITICDNDFVEMSNLNRQFLYSEEDIGKRKVDIAVHKIKTYNPHIKINGVSRFAHRDFTRSDVVIDCTDNLDSRLRISRLCKRAKKPLIYASAVGYMARVAVFKNKYLHEFVIASKGEEGYESMGIYPPAAALAGCISASECTKLLLKNECDLENKMFFADLKRNKIRIIPIQ
ncbi:MAG: HesA/MoeB/ThiF family protein [Candidatus Micrarchaeia archaeon]